MNSEEELLVPRGVQSVPVDGLRAEVAAVQRHAQDVHLDARASCAVARAHVLARDKLREEARTRSLKMKEKQGNLCTSPLPSTKNTLEWTKSMVNKSANTSPPPPPAGCHCNQATTRLESREKLVLSPALTCHFSTVKMFKYLQSQAIKLKLSFARRQRETGRLYGRHPQMVVNIPLKTF